MTKELFPQTVLIVDDNAVNVTVLSKMLEYKGIHYNVAYNAAEAFRSIQEDKPDLILLDVFMPDTDGFEVCKTLKENDEFKEIPIIFITANANPDSILKGLELGAVDYLTKPIKSHELILKIKTHLELANTKKKLELQNKQLTELVATKDKLFTIISHDLRNPLSAVTGFSEILITQFPLLDDDKKIELLSMLNFSANNCLSLITNLLQWAKSQRGALTPNYNNYEISKIIEQTKLDLLLSLNAKQITLKIEAPENHIICTDKNIFQTILRNLITNAIKYSHENSEITVSVGKENDATHICVKDNGVGMTPDKLSKLFKIGERGISTEGTKFEAGTGLGLIVSQEFANILGGKIVAKSEVGVGTEFILCH